MLATHGEPVHGSEGDIEAKPQVLDAKFLLFSRWAIGASFATGSPHLASRCHSNLLARKMLRRLRDGERKVRWADGGEHESPSIESV